jgi:hypothetical protein
MPYVRRRENMEAWEAREVDNRRLRGEMRAAIEDEFDTTTLPQMVRDAVWEVVTQHADTYVETYDGYYEIANVARLAYSAGGANR